MTIFPCRGMRATRFLLILISCVAVASSAFAAPAAPKKKVKEEETTSTIDLPWTLRPFLRMTVDKELFIIAEDNAEWRIIRDDGAVMADKIFYSITLEDGSVISHRDFGNPITSRKHYANETGEGTDYFMHLPGKKGIALQYTLGVPNTRPFFLLKLQVKNEGAAPISVSKITSVIAGEQSVPNEGDQISFTPRRMTQRGAYPVFDMETAPLAVLFNNAATSRTLSLGILPAGAAKSGAAFVKNGAVITGEVASVFDPPITLAPGQTLDADPVWVSFNIPSPADVDMFFAWTHSTFKRPETQEMPKLFASVPSSSSAADLLAAARDWLEAGCEGALIPSGWEGAPGTLEGGASGYPKNMASAAREIKALNLKPGIVVDPLLVDLGNPAWSVEADGRRWSNLTSAEAKAEAAKRLKKLVTDGFEFFSIEQSIIPDAALRQMNITRTQADSLAFEVMIMAAGDKPVIPTSRARLGASSESWREAAACVSRMNEFGVPVGPVSLDASGAFAPSDDVLDAIASYAGPIELLGRPRDGLQKKLAKLFPKSARRAKPVDSAKLEESSKAR